MNNEDLFKGIDVVIVSVLKDREQLKGPNFSPYTSPLSHVEEIGKES